MPFIRGGNAEYLAPGLNRFTFRKLRERPSQFARYVRVETSTRAYEDFFDASGFGPLAKKGELAPTMLDEPIKIPGVRIVHDSFALGFLASEEMQQDEQYGVIAKLAGDLGRSARVTTELYGHDVLNHGFDTTRYVGRDGKALFATDHPIQGTGGTYANRPTVAVDLSEAALEAGIASFDGMVDERGITTELSPALLVITPGDRMLAKRLLQSAGLPGGNFNDVNPLYDEGLQVVVSNWLTDTDAWFLLAPASDSPIVFFWRQRPDTKTWDDDNADGTYHKIKQRHSTGFNDWRGAYGSPGA
jgi:phage major head subunit gpT-like protein